MTNSILNKNEGLKKFIKKRFLRIYPTYWVAVIASILLTICIKNTYTSNSKFWLIFFLFPIDVPYTLRIEWTLLYELGFYIIAVFFSFKKTRKLFFPFLLFWSAAIVLVTVIKSIPVSPTIKLPLMLFTRQNLSIIVGCLTYYLYQHSEFSKIKAISNKLVVLVLILLCFAFVTNYEVFYSRYAIGQVMHYILLIPILLCAILINIRPNNILVKIGNCSYGIYLIHASILLLVFELCSKWKLSLDIKVFCVAIAFSALAGVGMGLIDINIAKSLEKYTVQPLPWKKLGKFAFPIILSLLIISTVNAYTAKIQANSNQAEVYLEQKFDSSLAINNQDYNPGWVDSFKITHQENGTYRVIMNGWAFDPIANKLSTQIALVSNGKLLSGNLSWYDRHQVGDELGNPILKTCGFTFQSGDIASTDVSDDVAVYVQLDDGHYMELKYVQRPTIQK